MNDIKYAGFWIRMVASLIDSLAILIIIGPLLFYIYGFDYFISNKIIKGTWDLLLQYALPAIAIVLFWILRSATPGKEVVEIIIVDKTSLAPANPKQCIIRYLSYYLSLFTLGIGFLLIAFHPKKQGLHDLTANTVVIYKK